MLVKALVACMRKLLTILNAMLMLRNNGEWDESFTFKTVA